MINRQVQTIYCDDIRREVGGKISYIGVYSGALLVTAFPVTLPKLCLSINIVTSASEPLRSLTLRILKDEEMLQEIIFDKDQLASASESAEGLPDEERKDIAQVAQFMLVFSPMQFDGPCALRVRALTEKGELRGTSLRVDQTQPPNAPVSD